VKGYSILPKDNYFERVYAVVKKIPKGKVTTYGEIARFLGNPRSARAVGWALHVNPYEKLIPCHRVVNREGALSKSFVFGGKDEQLIRLIREGIEFQKNGKVNVLKYFWKPI
jgi:methylated-DNA-protein-cysteine methyltransferase-like protein